jgi:hypothetical protein
MIPNKDRALTEIGDRLTGVADPPTAVLRHNAYPFTNTEETPSSRRYSWLQYVLAAK